MIFYKIDLDVRAEMRDSDFMNKLALELVSDKDEDPCEKFLGKVNTLLDTEINDEKIVIQAYKLKDPVLSLVCCSSVERCIMK